MNLVELVQTRTADGVRLDGALALADALPDGKQPPVDAAICLHGVGSNFYSSSVAEGLTPKLLVDGIAVLRANTRGHDAISMAATLQGPRRLGSTFETVDDCRHDVVGWLEFLSSRGFNSIALIGHSLGAIKALCAVAQAPHPAARRIVAISPPRLSYSYFLNSPQREEFLAEFAAAQALVDAGEPDALVDVQLPLKFLFSAASYLDKYGPDERYNFLRLIDRIHLPTLFTFGELEVEHEMPFRGLPESITEAMSPTQPIRAVTIAGANHVYTGRLEELAYKVRSWLAASS